MSTEAIEPLSLDGLKAPDPRPHGAVGALQWLPIAELRVDRSYQRDIRGSGRSKILKIAAEFDWSCFSPVICAPAEGGGYAIIDGQHRATAASLIGVDKVPCLLVIADRARQAKSFAAVNGTVTRMNSYSVYRASRAAGDETILAIDALCASCGVRVLTTPRERPRLKPGDTLAVSALQGMFVRHGPEPLRKALLAIMTQGEFGTGLITPAMLSGLCLFFSGQAGRKMSHAQIQAFAELDLGEISDRAKSNKGHGKVGTLICEEVALRIGGSNSTERVRAVERVR